MRTVTVEEHFASPGFLDGPGRELRAQASKFGAAAAKLLEGLCDVGEKRIAEMDDARIDMQVLSLTSPGTEQLEPVDAIIVAREANQFLEGAVKSNPARFAGLATLPISAPEKASSSLNIMTANRECGNRQTGWDLHGRVKLRWQGRLGADAR
jgi:predicted TIM-barrel fold metal-dependent hydrolase